MSECGALLLPASLPVPVPGGLCKILTGEQALALLEADGERRVVVTADFQPEGCGRGGEAQLCVALQ